MEGMYALCLVGDAVCLRLWFYLFSSVDKPWHLDLAWFIVIHKWVLRGGRLISYLRGIWMVFTCMFPRLPPPWIHTLLSTHCDMLSFLFINCFAVIIFLYSFYFTFDHSVFWKLTKIPVCCQHTLLSLIWSLLVHGRSPMLWLIPDNCCTQEVIHNIVSFDSLAAWGIL